MKVAAKPRKHTGPAPLCACGCGHPVSRGYGKPWNAFVKNHHRRRWRAKGLSVEEARRAEYVFRTYGVTPEAFDSMVKAQGGVCAICCTDDPGGASWCVDHDHETGAVRGLLCRGCNAGIGNLRDDPKVIEAAARYVRKGGFR